MSVQEDRLGPAYKIVTPRLVIRCWSPQDAPLLKTAIDESREHLLPWMPWVTEESEPLSAKVKLMRLFRAKFDLDEDYAYGIFNKEETVVLGGTGLHLRAGEDIREIGYWVHRDHVRKGYATEAVAALTRVAFEIDKARRAEIIIADGNIPSLGVPKKLGFFQEGIRREFLQMRDGEYVNAHIWTMLPKEYRNLPIHENPVEAYDVMGNEIPLPQPTFGA
ncbi:MAG TPA: N-acetyltransferase [Myxococcales bacterium]|nr:GNAT family N-acetyltransferase [Deltaproteobacteria bacterium]HAA59212.1 N-acetyltransferase [Myxococcales bacterium]